MFAAIDIGTNTALLLIARIDENGNVCVVEDYAELPRLGEGLGNSSEISVAAAKRAAKTFMRFALLCEEHKVSKLAAVGTAALRKAKNCDQVIKQIFETSGIKIEVISGKEEARLTYQSATQDFGSDICVLDIGGGSTELISSCDMSHESCVSMPFGTVVLQEQFLKHDPVTDEEYEALCRFINLELQKYLSTPARHGFTESATGEQTPKPACPPWLRQRRGRRANTQFVACAGTPTALAAIALKLSTYDHKKVNGYQLSLTKIEEIISTLKPLSTEERRNLTGLHPARADVILTGSTILHLCMKHLGHESVTVSDKGVRWGLFYEKYVLSSRNSQ